MLKLRERVELKGRTLTVTPAAFDCLPRIRDFLITVAHAGATVTYGELREQLHLPYAPVGMGPLARPPVQGLRASASCLTFRLRLMPDGVSAEA